MIDLSPYDDDLTITTTIGEVPLYKFIEKFLKVQDKEGTIVQFRLNRAQRKLYIQMCERKRKGLPIRENILKARQLGASTFIAAVIFSFCISKPNQNAAIVADVAIHATNLFEKYKFFYNCLPESIKTRVPLVRSNAKELIFDFGDGLTSSIKIMVQGDNAGRSGTYQYLHLSECAFWENLKKTLVSLLQTVSQSNLDSMIFLETTGNGFNEYKERWDNDVIRGNYDAVFLGWYLDDGYVRSEPVDERYDDFEVEMFNKLNFLTQPQKNWYHAQYLEVQDSEFLKQEFPSTPIEAFIATGASFYSMPLINAQKEKTLENPPKYMVFGYEKRVSVDGQQIDISNIELLPSNTKSGCWRIYKEPQDGHPYVIGSDPAKGGANKFAIVVWDNAESDIVAVYDKAYGDEDSVAFQMYCACVYYNDALLTGEVNSGGRMLELCAKCGHRNIYQERDENDLSGRFANHYGYKTKTTNRDIMLGMTQEAFRDKPSCVPDYELIVEMENFQLINSKWQACSGETDDIIMAWAGIMYCRHFQTTIIRNNITKSFEEFREDPFAIARAHKQKNMIKKKGFVQW